MRSREAAEPVLVSPDVFRHEPVAIRITSPVLKPLPLDFRSRYISRKGMLLEVSPPVHRANPITKGLVLACHARLPHQEEVLRVEGKVAQIVPFAVDAHGSQFTLVGLRFEALDLKAARKLEAHELAFDMGKSAQRSARIPVEFPVQPEGMDVLSELRAMDLSMSGMFVGTRAKFPPGKELRLRFRLPSQNDPVGLAGRVIWQGEKNIAGREERVAGFGFQFVEIPPPTRTALATYYTRRTITSWE